MTLSLRVAAFVLLASVLAAGCSLEPSYRAADLRYDRGLAGVWRFESEGQSDGNAPISIAIEPRRLAIHNGRVNPDADVTSRDGPANSYLARLPVRAAASENLGYLHSTSRVSRCSDSSKLGTGLSRIRITQSRGS